MSASSDTEVPEGRLISIRKLVALDISLHGPRFILLEFGVGTPALLAFGLLVFLRSYWPLGAYLLLIGINYVPLLIYAIAFWRRHDLVVVLNRSEKDRYVRKYGFQQSFILIPLAIPILALVQRMGGHEKAAKSQIQ